MNGYQNIRIKLTSRVQLQSFNSSQFVRSLLSLIFLLGEYGPSGSNLN